MYRQMYRGKNGNFRCRICPYSKKTTKEMDDEHMKDKHPAQAEAHLATQTNKPPRTRSPRPAKSSVASSLLSSGTNAPQVRADESSVVGPGPHDQADDVGQPSESHPVSIDQAGETSNVSHPPGEFTFQAQTLPDPKDEGQQSTSQLVSVNQASPATVSHTSGGFTYPAESIQDPKDEGQPSTSQIVSVNQASPSTVSHPSGGFTYPAQSIQDDEFYPSFTINFLMNIGLDVIKCQSKEEALTKHKILSTMPKLHFIKSSCACTVDGAPCVAVEQHQNISYKTEEHRQSAIRHIINTGVQLEISGILHANLTELVDVDLLPKYHSIPTHYDSYDTFRKNIGNQCQQICQSADQIIGAEGVKNKEYQMFRKRLLNCETIVDLDSMLRHPFVVPKRDRVFYFDSCRLALKYYSQLHHSEFNQLIADFLREDFSQHLKGKGKASVALKPQQNLRWENTLRASKKKNLVNMLEKRIENKEKVVYQDTSFSNHTFTYNSLRHMNDEGTKVTSVEDMHKDVEAVFPLYSFEIWEYMHIKGLNAQFGREQYGYFFVDSVKKITVRKDEKRFHFPSLLQACRMLRSMIAKFQNCHERSFPHHVPFTSELKIATSELEYCIQGLETSNQEYHQCVLLVMKKDRMEGLDALVFKSVRLILFALCFLIAMRDKKTNTGSGITNALEQTSLILTPFSNSRKMQINHLDSPHWPSKINVCKITGLHFIMSQESRDSFEKEIDEEIDKLYVMLDD